MTTRLPRQALLFTKSFIEHAAKHGLRKGAAKAVARANPALLVIDAAGSVLDAVDSYLQLRKAQERLDGLRRLVPLEEETLALERDGLRAALDLAVRELAQHRQVRRCIGELVLQCGRASNHCWRELQAIRRSELPDIEAFDRTLVQLEQAQSDIKRTLALFNETLS